MPAANIAATVEGGAEWVDVVVSGPGGRAGGASFEEVALVLELHGVSTGMKLERLHGISWLIEEKA